VALLFYGIAERAQSDGIKRQKTGVARSFLFAPLEFKESLFSYPSGSTITHNCVVDIKIKNPTSILRLIGFCCL